MPRIHILGPSGSGTTTLASALAARLRCPAYETDDFYWLPTEPPFQTKRPVATRLELLDAALGETEHWVLAGSLCGWGDPLIPRFEFVVLLELDPAIRLRRLQERELNRYGARRISTGGDLHAKYEAFLDWAARYDEGGMDVRSRLLHETWMAALPPRIRVLRLDSQQSVDELLSTVLQTAGVSSDHEHG
jgi:adenylate kinase family enzyme